MIVRGLQGRGRKENGEEFTETADRGEERERRRAAAEE